jgi:uncharacterized protein (TIGR03492 family)
MRLLCLSNGHGEDTIALQVLKALRQLPHAPTTIEVMPIVGEGHAYAKAGFTIIGTVKQMPSGGFIYMDGKQLAKDIQGGLLKLTLQQLKTIRQWGKTSTPEPAMILAVGDIVPLLFAWQSGLPYAFIGTAKSEYYLRDETQWHSRDSWWDDRLALLAGGVYYPWERWLMGRSRCKANFPRDRITAHQLQQFGLPAYDFGNPMMDLEAPDTDRPIDLPEESNPLNILLLPGSRAPEAYRNWDILILAMQNLVEQFHVGNASQNGNRSLHFLAALSPELETEKLEKALTQANWTSTELNTFVHPDNSHRLTLGFAKFAEFAHRADSAIAMAGTATEQFVGLGKPAITLSGPGPQFTPAFAEAQKRLLGCSILHLDHPSQVAHTLQALQQDPDRLATIARNGPQRMGKSGSASRIAQKLVQILSQL